MLEGFTYSDGIYIGANIQYVENPGENKEYIQKIIDYNEDDCRTTVLVEDWLVTILSMT
ncbi:ribonuclease H-like domain-containing protein [Chloroflexota bacterium]